VEIHSLSAAEIVLVLAYSFKSGTIFAIVRLPSRRFSRSASQAAEGGASRILGLRQFADTAGGGGLPQKFYAALACFKRFYAGFLVPTFQVGGSKGLSSPVPFDGECRPVFE
jgi:hypothetical protein